MTFQAGTWKKYQHTDQFARETGIWYPSTFEAREAVAPEVPAPPIATGRLSDPLQP